MGNEDLLQKLKSGDAAAYSELIHLYANTVINTCYRFLLNKEDAEDVSQEVFIEVFRSINGYRADASLATWIYRIAVSKSMDEVKKRNRKKRLGSMSKFLHLDEIAHWFAGESQADKNLVRKDEMEGIKRALYTLPDNQRIAFTLSKIEGYSNTEIAEIMQTSVLAVETLKSRAKSKMQKEMEKSLKNI